MNPSTEALLHLIETVHRLRAPGGCPWDRAQTHQSLRQYLIEEAYEVLDVLDEIDSEQALKKNDVRERFREELGDLLMQVLLHSEMTAEVGAFNIYDVARGLDEKLVRRHPHVFGEVKADSADSALQNWEKQKAKEKAAKSVDASVLDGLPKGLPALQRSGRMIEKVTKVGFQWKDWHGPLSKVEEELTELKQELEKLEKQDTPEIREKVASEIGDLLFSVCNLAQMKRISPEDALRGTLSKFERRFRHVEKRVRQSGRALEDCSLEEMDRYWNEAKAGEHNRGSGT